MIRKGKMHLETAWKIRDRFTHTHIHKYTHQHIHKPATHNKMKWIACHTKWKWWTTNRCLNHTSCTEEKRASIAYFHHLEHNTKIYIEQRHTFVWCTIITQQIASNQILFHMNLFILLMMLPSLFLFSLKIHMILDETLQLKWESDEID